MDDDVAAILGLKPLEMKRGIAALGWIGSVPNATWRLGAAAVLLPAFVAVIMHLSQLPTPQNAGPSAALASHEQLMALQGGSQAPLGPATSLPSPADAIEPATARPIHPGPRPATRTLGGDLGPQAEVRQANAGAFVTPAQRSNDELGASGPAVDVGAPVRTTRPPTVLQAQTDAAPEQVVRQELVTARLDAVDALRALRQK